MGALEIKGSSFNFSTLRILNTNEHIFAKDFELWMQKSPQFLINAPLILQVDSDLFLSVSLLKSLIQIIRTSGAIPFGLMSTDARHQCIAKECGLALITRDTIKAKFDKPKSENNTTLIHKQTIRSGQQLYAKNSDLIIIGSVNPGAEIIADGSVHIYGCLSGKALAGANGNEEAHIFAKQFKPQMVAIAGYYKIVEEIPVEFMDKFVQSFLINSRLSFATI